MLMVIDVHDARDLPAQNKRKKHKIIGESEQFSYSQISPALFYDWRIVNNCPQMDVNHNLFW
jgi:hypothetical protein